jgi:YesN/AraC family two-component response regulator
MTNTLVQQMIEQIENGYAGVVTLRQMASAFGRHRAYLGQVFHRHVGSTARQYLTRIRLQHAAELVRDGVKIEAVALIVGYRSKKNFYRQFKRHYGMTPMRYRATIAPAEPC